MKRTAWISALILLSGSLAASAASGLRAVDDPPPEPVTCPLCGGDPMVHVQKTFAILEAGSDAALRVLRW